MKKSVAMATYNGEAFIIEQLESIRTQTVSVDEVRICDDQSKDATVQIVQQYIEEHHLAPDWSITINEKNLGYASNFMKAVSLTDGDIVFFCDQDDIWVTDRVEKMSNIMKENSRIQLLGSEFQPFTDGENSHEVPEWELKMMRNDGSLEHKSFEPDNIFIGCQGCTMCIRRSLLEVALPYWYEGWAHDEFVWKTALCLDGLYMYHSYTLKRRLHASNASLNKMHTLEPRLKYLTDLLTSHEATLMFAQEIRLDKKQIRLLERNIHATQLRIRLLQDKAIFNTIPLVFKYSDCYHKRRAILVELLIAIRS